MLAAGLVECRRLGTGRVLLTPRPGQRIIAEGDPGERRRSGRPEAGRVRFWIRLDGAGSWAGLPAARTRG